MRWFRDIPAPSDDVPVSLALSDANHAVSLTKQLMGPGEIIFFLLVSNACFDIRALTLPFSLQFT